jgi:hypothetical protein
MVDFEYEIIAIVVIVSLILYPILIFIDWYTWWNKYDTKKQYSCFSLASLAYFKYNYPFYLIVNNLYGPSRFDADWQVQFITAIMGGEAKGIVGSNPNDGLCTPATLCHTLVPTEYPGLLPHGFDRQWPTSNDGPKGWKALLMAWMGMTKIPSSQAEYSKIATAGINKWNEPTNSNFLAKWGISPLSPIVVAFIMGQTTFGTDVIDSSAIEPLLGKPLGGLGEGKGGWFGFLKAGTPGYLNSVDQAFRAVWSSESPPPSSITNAHKSKCSGTAIASGAVGMAASGAMAGGMIAPPEGIVIGAILGGLVGAFTGSISGHCL